MKCVIQCFQPFRNRLEIITIKDDKIYYDDGRYEKLILDDEDEVERLYSRLYSLIFSWKQEYIGDRVVDGEKYLIELDVTSPAIADLTAAIAPSAPSRVS